MQCVFYASCRTKLHIPVMLTTADNLAADVRALMENLNIQKYARYAQVSKNT